MRQHLPQLMQLLFTAVFYVATGELSNLLPQLAYLQAHRARVEAAWECYANFAQSNLIHDPVSLRCRATC